MPLHDPSSAKPCRRARTHSSCFSSPIWSVGGGQPRTRRSGIFRSSRQSMTSWWPDPVVVPSTSTIDAMPHTSSHDCPSRPMRQHWLSTMTPPWHAGSSILQFSEGPSSPSSPPSSNSSRNCATDRSGASSASARSAPVRASVIRRGHQRPPTGWVSRSKAKRPGGEDHMEGRLVGGDRFVGKTGFLSPCSVQSSTTVSLLDLSPRSRRAARPAGVGKRSSDASLAWYSPGGEME